MVGITRSKVLFFLFFSSFLSSCPFYFSSSLNGFLNCLLIIFVLFPNLLLILVVFLLLFRLFSFLVFLRFSSHTCLAGWRLHALHLCLRLLSLCLVFRFFFSSHKGPALSGKQLLTGIYLYFLAIVSNFSSLFSSSYSLGAAAPASPLCYASSFSSPASGYLT